MSFSALLVRHFQTPGRHTEIGPSVRGKVRPKPQCGWVLFPDEPQLSLLLKLARSAHTQYRIDCTCRRERRLIFQDSEGCFHRSCRRWPLQRATRAPCRALNRVGVHEEFLDAPDATHRALRTAWAAQTRRSLLLPGHVVVSMKSADAKGNQKTMSFDALWVCLRPTTTPSGRLTFFCTNVNMASSKHAHPALRKTSDEEQLIVRDEKPKGESYKRKQKKFVGTKDVHFVKISWGFIGL